VKTLAEVTEAHGFEVYEYLEASAEVPVVAGLQAQGDVIIVPARGRDARSDRSWAVVPAEGIPVVSPVGSGHEHRLFAGAPGTALFEASGRGQDVGVLECSEPAYLLHPEHGAAGIAPGTYIMRRQREQADEERLIAD
jgi:hypothetical protein